jgi:hypothetical protein
MKQWQTDLLGERPINEESRGMRVKGLIRRPELDSSRRQEQRTRQPPPQQQWAPLAEKKGSPQNDCSVAVLKVHGTSLGEPLVGWAVAADLELEWTNPIGNEAKLLASPAAAVAAATPVLGLTRRAGIPMMAPPKRKVARYCRDEKQKHCLGTLTAGALPRLDEWDWFYWWFSVINEWVDTGRRPSRSRRGVLQQSVGSCRLRQGRSIQWRGWWRSRLIYFWFLTWYGSSMIHITKGLLDLFHSHRVMNNLPHWWVNVPYTHIRKLYLAQESTLIDLYCLDNLLSNESLALWTHGW